MRGEGRSRRGVGWGAGAGLEVGLRAVMVLFSRWGSWGG